MPYLVIFSADWADEFTCEDYQVLRRPLADIQQELTRIVDSPEGLYFGTNEGWEPGTLDAQTVFTVTAITEEAATILEGLLGARFGLGLAGALFEEERGYASS